MWARQDPGKQKRQGVQGQLAGHGQGAVSSAHNAGAAGELVLLQCLCIEMYARKSVSTMIMGTLIVLAWTTGDLPMDFRD